MTLPREGPWTLTARWIFPVDGPPLEGGTLTIAGERILSVDPHGKQNADRDLGDAAILPGLVNAHTHLDLTGLRGKVPPGGDFTRWLRSVIAHRRNRSQEEVLKDVKEGLAESVSFGTTLLGDISALGASWEPLSKGGFSGRAVVFYELLGLPKTRAQQAWAGACRWLADHPPMQTCRPGLSPHAPYSVRRSLFQAAANVAANRCLPLASHLTETQAELELLRDRRGPFVDFLKEVGVWDADGLVEGTDEVLTVSQQVRHFLIVHGNYLDPATIPRGSTVVYCPRTHAAFGHGQHPVRDLLARGVRIALGTDSLASNPDLNVLAEARYVKDCFPDLAGASLLSMATLCGAEALGWATETGSLTPGKSADLVVVRLAQTNEADPHEILWKSPPRIMAALSRGQWTYVDAHCRI